MTTRLTDEAFDLLLAGQERYQAEVSPHYDEVVHEVSARALSAGFLTKLDIGGLVLWKRLQANTKWAAKLMARPEKEVREVTGRMCRAARRDDAEPAIAAQEARSSLVVLPGMRSGDALASALILVAAPDRMAVYDRRANAGLRVLGLPVTAGPGRYSRYVGVLADIAEQCSARTGTQWTPRDVDCSLYFVGERGSSSVAGSSPTK